MSLTLTKDQQTAADGFCKYLCNPNESVFLLEGYSGTGKSTLVRELLDRLPGYIKTAKLLNPRFTDYNIILTATTNKAVEALSDLALEEVKTIYSLLGLRPYKDFVTGKSSLILNSRAQVIYDSLIFIDECSYIDSELLDWIFKRTVNCKIVFMGDRAQLIPVNSAYPPVFSAGFTGAMLSETVRNQGQILELATMFRHTVASGEFFQFKPNGTEIIHLDQNDFNDAILAEFATPYWKNDSKILAYTNDRTIAYNNFIVEHMTGSPEFKKGDYAVVNQFIGGGSTSFKTDQTVKITDLNPSIEYGVPGQLVQVDGKASFFMADSLEQRKHIIKYLKSIEDHQRLRTIDSHWIDLRAAYASTVNKAQGSTYRKVYIDVGNIAAKNSGNQIARLMYVAVSRAQHQVILTGDF